MQLHSYKARPEACASKDQTRPVLTCLHLRINEDGTATLEATDSYQAISIPVTVEEGDTEGLIPVEAVTEARKQGRGTKEVNLEANGKVIAPNGASWVRPEGTFPKIPELIPAQLAEFEIGLNPTLLANMAKAFGAETVRIQFCAGSNGMPDNLRPMVVTPRSGDLQGEAKGILMPVRLS
jgi:DNA polymerase III sliding clamp (beta) subunit (PCNA family)